jgi:hypothetical protein
VVHRNAPLTETAGCGWPAASSTTAGRCGPRNGSRSRTPPRPGGQPGTGRPAPQAWLTGRRSPGPARPARRGAPSGGSSACGSASGSARPGSPSASAWHPPPCTPSWSATPARASRTWTAAPASRSAATNATGPAFGDQRIGIIFRDEDARTPIIGLVPAAGEYWSGSMYPRVLVLPGLGGGGTVESCRRQGDRWARDVWAPGSCHFRGICLSWQLTHLPVSELPLARRWR